MKAGVARLDREARVVRFDGVLVPSEHDVGGAAAEYPFAQFGAFLTQASASESARVPSPIAAKAPERFEYRMWLALSRLIARVKCFAASAYRPAPNAALPFSLANADASPLPPASSSESLRPAKGSALGAAWALAGAGAALGAPARARW